jgi:hypothetical protein
MSPYSLDDFAFDLRRAALPADIWVGSGWTTVAPTAGSVAGVGGWFAPPYAAPDSRLSMTIEVDGRPVPDGARPGMGDRGLLYAGGTWRPDHVVRNGTYHQYRDGALVSVAVRSSLTPLYGAAGYRLEVSVRNRTDRVLRVALRPELTSGGVAEVPLSQWGWMPPTSGSLTPTLVHSGAVQHVPPDGSAEFITTVLIGSDNVDPVDTTGVWQGRLRQTLHRVPRVATDIAGLEAYYRRSLASGLVCLWDNPTVVTTPFVATSGLDGGAVCAYAWDTGGYAPHLLTLMLGSSVGDLIKAMVRADLTSSYAIAPDGSGVGVPYAYSGWSLLSLAYAMAAQHGIDADLVYRLYDVHKALDGRFRPDPGSGGLRDYGDQHNLLEMRGAGWEHVVASPNAERARSLEMLAQLALASGATLPVALLREQVEAIRSAVMAQLWDDTAGWFRSRYPDGHTELAYSVQAFDALRAGAGTPAIAAAMLTHLRPGAFLGEYGVSSISAEDERHYELGDIDWSGGGAYTGEAPQLALTLWERGESALAWQVMRRLLWMGEHFPYFPQEHYCDRPAAPPVGRRANVIAGLTGAEAILTGLAGIRPQPDGSLVVDPHPVPEGTVELTGLEFRGRSVDVVVAPDGCQVTVDGREMYAGAARQVLAVAGHNSRHPRESM